LPEQPDPPLGEVVPIPTLPEHGGRRMRAIDDAWEAVVREEMARIRRSRAREGRFSRRDEQG
jgi:hypothetical protein